MDPRLQKWIEQAEAALARGVDPAAIDSTFAELSEGRFKSLAEVKAALAQAVKPPAGTHPLDVTNPESGIRRVARAAVPFGLSDELAGFMAKIAPGGQTGRQAMDASRELMAEQRQDRPGATFVSELFGNALVPLGGAGIARAAGAGLKGAIAAGGATGAAGGALYGAGTSEADNVLGRVADAIPDALAGAGTGMVAAPVAAVAGKTIRRLVGSRGSRIAKDLQRTSGLSSDINAAIRKADEAIEAVRADHYRPLQTKFAKVDDPEIKAFLELPDVVSHARAVSKELPGRAPSLVELQKIRGRLRKKDFDLHKQIDELMQNKIEGLELADQAYAQKIGQRRALEIGAKAPGWSAAQIERVMADLPDEAAKVQFRKGHIHEVVRKLTTFKDEESVTQLRRILDMGDESRAAFRTLFPEGDAGNKAFAEFERIARTERNAEKIARALTLRWLRPTVLLSR